MDETKIINQIKKELDGAKTIALFCHARPDGDTLGAMLGMGWALEDAGKIVQYLCADPLPTQNWLNPPETELPAFQAEPGPFDCSILLDISVKDRISSAFFARQGAPLPTVCIDHHVTNDGIAKINWIHSVAAATCEMVARLLIDLQYPITPRIADALYSGLLTDTQSFSTSNTTPNTLRIASLLIEKGADFYSLTRRVMKEHTFSASKLWGIGLTHMQMEDGVVWALITEEDRENADYQRLDDAGLVDHLATTEFARAAFLMMEQPNKMIKVSWRSQPPINVALVAKQFGGGGHSQAAGASFSGTIEESLPDIILATKKAVYHEGRSEERRTVNHA